MGAVVLGRDGTVLARAGNAVEAQADASAHAELLAMRAAAATARRATRLPDCDLVVTLEPCPMCAQAISLFRIRRLVFGAYDPEGRRRRARRAGVRRRILPPSTRGGRRGPGSGGRRPATRVLPGSEITERAMQAGECWPIGRRLRTSSRRTASTGSRWESGSCSVYGVPLSLGDGCGKASKALAQSYRKRLSHTGNGKKVWMRACMNPNSGWNWQW